MIKFCCYQLTIIILSTSFPQYYCQNNTQQEVVLYPTLESVVRNFGYSYENHTVITQDGWILSLGRIPYQSHRNSCNKKRGTILLSHGIFNNGVLFVYLGPKKSIALTFSDMCYDVWLNNVRGTRYSRHKLYTKDDKEYWDYSIDDLAMYDTSASIKYITKSTGEQKIHYIGFSLGTSQIIALLAAKPEYQMHITSLHLIAPVASLKNFQSYPKSTPKSLLKQLIEETPEIFLKPFPDNRDIVKDMISRSCVPYISQTCETVMELLFDGVGNEKWVHHFPDYSSFKVMAHITQQFFNDNYSMYNYSKKKNLELYGSEAAPSYKIEKIRSPVYIYHALGDIFSTPLDVKKLAQQLPNLKKIHFINQTDFSHSSFNNYYNNTKELFHRYLFDSLEEYG